MRWLVEVTALGKSDKESLVVEADSWQKALQAARSQRGDTAPMSGFSIELLDDGCRAVDPTSRLRYEVRKAAEDAVASAKSQPPRPVATQAKRPAAVTRTLIGAGPSSTPPPSAASPAPTSAVAATPVSAAPASVPPRPAASPAPRRRAGAAPASVPSQILFKREQDASEAMPLTYREYVFLVAPGTSEAAAETLLLTQLAIVRTSIERVAPGKLVNLGVFDVAFQGKPPLPPLATLVWKDWRGDPAVVAQSPPATRGPSAAPLRPARRRSRRGARGVAHADRGRGAGRRRARRLAPAGPAPGGQRPPRSGRARRLPPASRRRRPRRPPKSRLTGAGHRLRLRRPSRPRAGRTRSRPSPCLPRPRTPRLLRLPPAPPRRRPRAPRVRSEDLIADLFEAMHDLHFVRDALEGGEFCLALAMEKLPCQAGIVHLYDIDRREFLVTSTRGAGTSKLLLARHPENDAMLLGAMRKRRAAVVADARAERGREPSSATSLSAALAA